MVWRMSKRSRLIGMIVVSMVILFLASGLPVTANGSQNSGQNNPGGYVKYTLDLLNNTLINGNFVNTVNAMHPYGIAYDPFNGYIYVADSGSGTVSVINGTANTVIANISVGGRPWGVAYDSSNDYIYVTNYDSDTVSVINGTTVIANITVGLGPMGIVYDPSNGYIYVANYYSYTVSVINGATNTVIANIPVGSGPEGIAYDPSNGYLFVADSGSDSVSVIDGANNTVIATIPLGTLTEPTEIVYDPSNGYIYVTDTFSDTVSVISVISASTQVTKTYTVTFTESGLPTGTQWSVTLNGTTKSSSSTTITFTVPNGEYNYSAASPILVNGVEYVATEPTGTVTVNNNNVTVIVQYVPTTPPSPSLSSLAVQVFSAPNRLATSVSGVVFGVLYNSSGFGEVAFMNSSGFLNFNNISPGTYTLEVYHYPNTGLNLTEYWGGETINVQPGNNTATFTRDEPWIYNLQSSVINGSIVVTVTVNGTVTSPTQGEIELWVTSNPSLASPYSPSEAFYVTINPGLNTFNFTYPVSQAGTYYVYAAVLTYISTYTVTDQWNWTPTTVPSSSSSLTVLVYNVLGRPATTVPGVVLGVLYNSSGFSEVAYMNSSGYLNFNNISPGTYTLEVYHYPNTGLNLTEYWGGMTVNLQPGYNTATFIRHEPWIYNLQSSASNGSIVVTVTVNGTVTSPTPGEIELWVTSNPSLASPYNPSNVTYFTINPGLNTFNLTYPASQAGTYYVYAALLTYNGTQYIVTDQWNWTALTLSQNTTVTTPTTTSTSTSSTSTSTSVSTNSSSISSVTTPTTSTSTKPTPSAVPTLVVVVVVVVVVLVVALLMIKHRKP